MRIGIDCRLPAYRLGGIAQYVLALLPALAAIDGDNRYVVLQHRKDKADRSPPDASNFQSRRLWTPCHHRIERWSLAAELLPLRLDLLHSPDFIPPAAGARRRVITVHDLNFLYFPQFLTAESRRYYARQIRWAVRVADHILADSRQTREDLVSLLGVPQEKVTAVPLAAHPRFNSPPPADEMDRDLDRLGLSPGYLLHVGTLEPRKNIPFLLETYHRLRRQGVTEEPLVLVGRAGWLMDEIEATLTRLSLRPFVRHLNDVDDAQMPALYAGASLLALPSHYEGFGLPVLEAMHMGCPVVSSDRGSLPEVGGRAALLLPADDGDAWLEGLATVLYNGPRREAMIAAGHRQASCFSWAKSASQTLAVYQSVLA